MSDKEAKSTTRKIVTNDQANYYSWITSITVNRKNVYELKGKFLDDLHKNAFSGTNGEYAVEHIEYFLKIVDPIDLPNVNHDKLRVVVFPISLIDTDVLTNDIKGFKTYDEYKDDWIYEWNENVPWVHEKPWTDNRVWTEPAPVVHCCKPFNYKSGYWEWPTCSWKEDRYCNGGNLPGAYIVGNTLRYQDLEWYEALKDKKLKEEALRNKAIMEGLINDDVESNNEELPVCTIRRFEMIKYSFGQDEEYVAIKEDEYEDLTNTSKEAIHVYQEIFCMMDEGWMVTRAE
ncbi:hypothetical protein Tco_1055140 [Tanacetum coccineum]|uniref:Uncharacterized protein n=1 Tax=Tanacetum coccineum TaxID=301880 RepID=A0ABQ5H147_9ASTR